MVKSVQQTPHWGEVGLPNNDYVDRKVSPAVHVSNDIIEATSIKHNGNLDIGYSNTH